MALKHYLEKAAFTLKKLSTFWLDDICQQEYLFLDVYGSMQHQDQVFLSNPANSVYLQFEFTSVCMAI